MPAPASPRHSFSNGRRWLNWLNTFLAVAAVLAMLVMANYLADGHFKRIQMDRNSIFKLSKQTLRVLDSLTNDVNVTVFFAPQGANEGIYDLVAGLLAEYQQACPRHIHVTTLDYDRDVGKAKEFLAKHSLNGLKEKDFVFFENGVNTRTAYAKELAKYDFSGLLSGQSKEVRRSAFLGELYFTEDIYDVSNPRPMKAYFLFGHGENDPEENKTHPEYSNSKLAAILKDEVDCDWDKLSLQGTNVIPADCQLLIVLASAREGRMTTNELAKIAVYLKQGGRMLALLTVPSGLESVLASWGVRVGNSRVEEMDKDFSLPDGTFLTAQLVRHPIMDPLISEKMPLRMVLPRPVYPPPENQSKIPGAPEITILAATSAQGMDELKHTGLFPLLVAVEQGSIQGVNSPGNGGTRIVVAGDTDFLDDQVIDSVGNHIFAQLALDWLLQRPQIMLDGLGPKPIKEYKLYMTATQEQSLRWLFLAGLPGGILLLGGLVWLRRRS